MSNRILKRRYTSNGFSVSIHYHPPDNYSDGFFTISLGYDEKRIEYHDSEYVNIIIREPMNINYIWKDMVMFTEHFTTWNKQWIHVDDYNAVCDEVKLLKTQLNMLSR